MVAVRSAHLNKAGEFDPKKWIASLGISSQQSCERLAETWDYCREKTQGHPQADLLLWRGVEMVEIRSNPVIFNVPSGTSNVRSLYVPAVEISDEADVAKEASVEISLDAASDEFEDFASLVSLLHAPNMRLKNANPNSVIFFIILTSQLSFFSCQVFHQQ